MLFHKILPIGLLFLTACHPDSSLPTETAKASAGTVATANRCSFCLSDDKGNSWQPFEAGLPAGVKIYRITKHGNQLVMMTDKQGLYTTDIAKANWQKLETQQLPSQDISSLAVDGDGIYVALDEGVYSTHDKGRTWGFVAPKPDGDDNAIHAIFRVDGETWIGYKHGLYALSMSPMLAWQPLLDNVFTTKMERAGSSIFLGTNFGIAVSNDGGKNWEWSRKDRFVNKLMQVDGKLVALYHEADPEYSDDNGLTWKPIKNDAAAAASNMLEGVKSGKAYLSDQDGVYSRWSSKSLSFFTLDDEVSVDFLPAENSLYLWVVGRMDGC